MEREVYKRKVGGCNFSKFNPPKNLQFLMLILDEIGGVKGITKLFKIHYLIESEGHVKYDLPVENYPLGPVDYNTFDFAMEEGLLEKTLCSAEPYDYYNITITGKGKKFFEEKCKPLMKVKDVSEAKKIIKCYNQKSATTILNYVHSKYVDCFKSKSYTLNYINDYTNRVIMYIDLIYKELQKNETYNDKTYILLGHLSHINKILEGLKDVNDPVKRGTSLYSISDFLQNVREKYQIDFYLEELFDYLDNYCDKEGIYPSISSDDLSDIPLNERKKLIKAFVLIEPSDLKRGDSKRMERQKSPMKIQQYS